MWNTQPSSNLSLSYTVWLKVTTGLSGWLKLAQSSNNLGDLVVLSFVVNMEWLWAEDSTVVFVSDSLEKLEWLSTNDFCLSPDWYVVQVHIVRHRAPRQRQTQLLNLNSILELRVPKCRISLLTGPYSLTHADISLPCYEFIRYWRGRATIGGSR